MSEEHQKRQTRQDLPNPNGEGHPDVEQPVESQHERRPSRLAASEGLESKVLPDVGVHRGPVTPHKNPSDPPKMIG